MRSLFFSILFCLTMVVSGQELSVMTYNIRLDYSGDKENQWTNRKEKMISQLKFYEPDIFGIQEGLLNQVEYLDENLPDYTYIGVGRDDGKKKGEFSAIYYKSDIFNLLESGTFWLSATPGEPSVGWDAALPRICTYGLFERKSDGQKFWMFNTHFDHVGVEARVNAMKLILKRIQAFNKENYPVVLSGDLNVTPDEGAIQEMKKVLQDTRDAADVVFGPDATFNAFKFQEPPTHRIDYIAVNEHLKVLKYAVLTDSYAQKYISDHFPVFCVLSFKD